MRRSIPTLAGVSKRTTVHKPVVESEKPKSYTVKAKTVVTKLPLASKSPTLTRRSVKTGHTVKENKSDRTEETPVKDDITKRSTKTARTPPN